MTAPLENPYAGELRLKIGGQDHVLRLTLGALAELEHSLQEDSLLSLVERFEQGRYSSRDVLALLVAGLRGGGWRGGPDDLLCVEFDGGLAGAAGAAALLLARAFGPVGPAP